MKKKSFNQIMKIIKDNLSVSDFGHGYNSSMQSLNLGPVEVVDRYGGEDQGTNWYRVKHFVDHDVYIRTNGYYSSYDGVDFYEGYGYEVIPTEVKVIQYLAAPIVEDAEEDRVLSGSELIAKLQSNIDKDQFGEDGYDTVDEDLFGENEIVDSYGNHEGAGEVAYTVRFFKYHNVYIRLNGFYSSYAGCDWGDYTEVRPAQKTITVFE